MTVSIEAATVADAELVDAFAPADAAAVLLQSTTDAEALEEIVASPATVLFTARGEDGSIVGSLTLVLFRIPTGSRAWIEDVVVDEAARGQGVGAALNEAALAHARSVGARTVDLTSRATREVANRLYQRLGFVPRDTNIYRYDL